MKKLLFIFLLVSPSLFAQQLSKADRKAGKRIFNDIQYLASDKLEGRRTGTEGEALAYEYIMGKFRAIGLQPKGGEAGSYLQPFNVYEGKEIKPSTVFYIDEVALAPGKDFFPLPFSSNTENPVMAKISHKDSGQIWLIDLKDTLMGAQINPHFDVNAYMLSKATQAESLGAKGVVFINSSSVKDDIHFNPKERAKAIGIPVVFLNDKEFSKKVDIDAGRQLIKLNVETGDKNSTGHNIVGYIDNKAANTIVVGAHYDHLGYGQDRNSLYAGPERLVHNGADDNASGVATMIELANWIRRSPLRAYNYLFIAFSGEELGLYGSKYFVQNATVDLKKVNYMINLDMVGRLNAESKGLNIGGYGTSPYWQQHISSTDDYFTIKFDSSGAGPSDHTSFYRADIPVLFFFTGTHSDYHKPTDDAEKINVEGTVKLLNYIKNILVGTNYEGKIAFTKTREKDMGKSSFKVSLGIMPDYTYSGSGVLVDGMSEGKAAQRAGVQKGDVLISLGAFEFTDVQSYMGALNKFDKGDTTKLKLKRGSEVIELMITF